MTAEQRQYKLYAGNTIEIEGWHDRWKKGLTRWMIPFVYPYVIFFEKFYFYIRINKIARNFTLMAYLIFLIWKIAVN